MIVKLKCQKCSFDDEDDEIGHNMRPLGPLIMNDDKDQFQEYICDTCKYLVRVMINTTKEIEK